MNAIHPEHLAKAESSSYHAVQLMLVRGLDYMQKAANAFDEGSGEGWCKAIIDAHTIISGLRASLDMKNGGSLADNLDGLYEYMLMRLNVAFEEVDVDALSEVYDLLEEVKRGWDGIEDIAAENMAISA